MSRTILVPTDLSVGSLNTLKHALEQGRTEEMNVVLLHARQLSTSITDLLFHSRERQLESLLTDEFVQALQVIRNRFGSRISSLRIEVFHGRTRGAFDQFCQANGVDEVHLTAGYKPVLRGLAFDPTALVKGGRVPVTVHGSVAEPMYVKTDQLDAIFQQ